MPASRSSEPSAARSAESAWSAQRRAASSPCSTETSGAEEPRVQHLPVHDRHLPGDERQGARHDRPARTRRRAGGGGSSRPSSARRLRGSPRRPCARILATRTACVRPASRGSLAQERPALDLVQAAPDAVGLPDPQGVLEARLAATGHGSTDRLGLGLAGVLLLALLEVVRREEQRRSPRRGTRPRAASPSSNPRSRHPAGWPSLRRPRPGARTGRSPGRS